MKEIFKNIWKRKLFNILIFLQLMFSLLYFFFTTISIQAAMNTEIAVNSELDTSPDKVIHMTVQDEEIEPENFKNFKRELLESNTVKNVSGWVSNYLVPTNHTIGESDGYDSINISEDCEELKNVTVESGRYFNEDDYNPKKANGTKKKPYSIIIGCDFASENHLKAGDIYRDFGDYNYKIVGVLAPNSKWFYQAITDGMIMVADNAVMVPHTGNIEDIPILNYYSVIQENVDSEKAIDTINTIAHKNNVILSASTLSSELSEIHNENMSKNGGWMLLSVIIMFFVGVGTSVLIISHMYMQKEEIGIRVAYGYSFKKILFVFLGEFLVVAVLAFLYATVITVLTNSNGVEILSSAYMYSSYRFTPEIFILGIVAFIVMCLPTLFVLVFKLKKIQPKNLIGGK